MAKKPDKNKATGTIALNKRALHEYHLDDRFEAGLALQGWELKSIRAGRANIGESYAVVRDGELFLFGAQITPLISTCTHVVADDRRTRKLLLHRREIDTLIGRVQRDGAVIHVVAELVEDISPLLDEIVGLNAAPAASPPPGPPT